MAKDGVIPVPSRVVLNEEMFDSFLRNCHAIDRAVSKGVLALIKERIENPGPEVTKYVFPLGTLLKGAMPQYAGPDAPPRVHYNDGVLRVMFVSADKLPLCYSFPAELNYLGRKDGNVTTWLARQRACPKRYLVTSDELQSAPKGLRNYPPSPLRLLLAERDEGLAELERRKEALLSEFAGRREPLVEELRAKVPRRLSTWLSKTELFGGLAHHGFAWAYEYHQDFLNEWGFRSLEDCMQKLLSLSEAWEGLVTVEAEINEFESRVEATFRVV